jgi:hypothetical protein
VSNYQILDTARRDAAVLPLPSRACGGFDGVEGENGKTAMPRPQANPANLKDTRCTSTQNIPKRNYELQEGKEHHQAAYFAKLTKAIRDLQNITTRKTMTTRR